MISVVWSLKDRTLSFDGHATCDYVCAAVSVLVATLYVGYGMLTPPKSGTFVYEESDSTDAPAVEFVRKALCVLELKYPNQVQFLEVA